MGYANDKGARFERKLVKLFSDYWGIDFGRSVDSGAYRGTNKEYVGLGDLQPPVNNDFPFIIEAKHHEDWSLDQVLFSKGKVKDFWKQVVSDSRGAVEIPKAPLLAFTKKYADDYIMIPYNEKVYDSISRQGLQVARIAFSIDNTIKKENLTYDLLLTNFKGFSSVDKKLYIETFLNKDWESFSLIQDKDNKPNPIEEKEDMDSLLDKLFEV